MHQQVENQSPPKLLQRAFSVGNTSPATPSFLQVVKRIFSSTFSLLLLFCLPLALGLLAVYILASNPEQDTVKWRPLGQNIIDAIDAKKDADIWIMGSSLNLHPCVRCDDKLDGKKKRYDSWYSNNHIHSYGKARFLQSLFARRGKSLEIANLACPGSLLSDDLLTLNTMLEHGKKCKVIILGLGPKDLHDNMQAKPADTMARKALEQLLKDYDKRIKLGPVEELSEEIKQRNNLLSNRYYRERLAAEIAVTEFIGKPVSDRMRKRLNPDVWKDTPLYTPQVSRSYGLDEYKRIYNPYNAELFDLQSSSLEQFLSLAKSRGLKVVVLKMPLPPENLALISKRHSKVYDNYLSKLAAAGKAVLIDAGAEADFSTQCFDDACHLNEKGGEMLYKIICQHCSELFP